MRIIISAVAGTHYRKLQVRTMKACSEYSPEAVLAFLQLPERWSYMVKIKAMGAALMDQPIGLWMDVSFRPVASMEPLWRHIEEHGWFAQKQGDAKLGTWASDRAISAYGITRNEAMGIPMCFSGIVGFDFGSELGRRLFDSWASLAHTFDGPHYNRPGEEVMPLGAKFTGHASNDPRVEGHRHDEAALSFVLWNHGLAPVESRFLSINQESGFIIDRNFVNMDGTYAD